MEITTRSCYKRSGKDPNALKVTKPTITKVPLNKEDISPFHKQITENKVEKLQPVYVDYNKDLVKLKMNKDVEVLYTPNKDNDLFTLYYLSDVGTNNNPKMDVAVEYLEYVGTEDMTAEDSSERIL
jgi:zinc protease